MDDSDDGKGKGCKSKKSISTSSRQNFLIGDATEILPMEKLGRMVDDEFPVHLLMYDAMEGTSGLAIVEVPFPPRKSVPIRDPTPRLLK